MFDMDFTIICMFEHVKLLSSIFLIVVAFASLKPLVRKVAYRVG